MTRMTGPDCVVMCNLINTYIHTYIHTYILWAWTLTRMGDHNKNSIITTVGCKRILSGELEDAGQRARGGTENYLTNCVADGVRIIIEIRSGWRESPPQNPGRAMVVSWHDGEGRGHHQTTVFTIHSVEEGKREDSPGPASEERNGRYG